MQHRHESNSWRVLLFSVVVMEVQLPILRHWGLAVKKSRINLQREAFSIVRIFCGVIVFNAKHNFMNRIIKLIYHSSNRSEKVDGSDMAFSLAVVRVGILKWVKWGGKTALYVFHD